MPLGLWHPPPEFQATLLQQFEETVWTSHRILLSIQIKCSIQLSGMLYIAATHKPLKHLLNYKPRKQCPKTQGYKKGWTASLRSSPATHKYFSFPYQSAQHIQECYKCLEICMILSSKIYECPQHIIARQELWFFLITYDKIKGHYRTQKLSSLKTA